MLRRRTLYICAGINYLLAPSMIQHGLILIDHKKVHQFIRGQFMLPGKGKVFHGALFSNCNKCVLESLFEKIQIGNDFILATKISLTMHLQRQYLQKDFIIASLIIQKIKRGPNSKRVFCYNNLFIIFFSKNHVRHLQSTVNQI